MIDNSISNDTCRNPIHQIKNHDNNESKAESKNSEKELKYFLLQDVTAWTCSPSIVPATDHHHHHQQQHQQQERSSDRHRPQQQPPQYQYQLQHKLRHQQQRQKNQSQKQQGQGQGGQHPEYNQHEQQPQQPQPQHDEDTKTRNWRIRRRPRRQNIVLTQNYICECCGCTKNQDYCSSIFCQRRDGNFRVITPAARHILPRHPILSPWIVVIVVITIVTLRTDMMSSHPNDVISVVWGKSINTENILSRKKSSNPERERRKEFKKMATTKMSKRTKTNSKSINDGLSSLPLESHSDDEDTHKNTFRERSEDVPEQFFSEEIQHDKTKTIASSINMETVSSHFKKKTRRNMKKKRIRLKKDTEIDNKGMKFKKVTRRKKKKNGGTKIQTTSNNHSGGGGESNAREVTLHDSIDNINRKVDDILLRPNYQLPQHTKTADDHNEIVAIEKTNDEKVKCDTLTATTTHLLQENKLQMLSRKLYNQPSLNSSVSNMLSTSVPVEEVSEYLQCNGETKIYQDKTDTIYSKDDIHIERIKNNKRSKKDLSSTLPFLDDVPVSSWVHRFLHSTNRNKDFLLPIPKDYCSDNFNLVQLPSIIESIGLYYKKMEEDENNSEKSVTLMMDPRQSKQKQPERYSIYRAALQLLIEDQPIYVGGSVLSNNHGENDNEESRFDFYDHVPSYINEAAIALYLLLHQRYVLSTRGLDAIRRRFLPRDTKLSRSAGDCNGRTKTNEVTVEPIFGRCPRPGCCGMPLLPVGDSDDYYYMPREEYNSKDELMPAASYNNHHDTTDLATSQNWNNIHYLVAQHNHCVKLYCAYCQEIFYNWDSTIDGCAWGASFCNLFLLVHGKEIFHPWILHKQQMQRQCMHNKNNIYDARIFGFKLHPSATIFDN